ncbi:MAG TPA: hypothetical protein VGM83_19890 [Devosiaceae bacterium]|jgi:hypothetical protein
MKTGLLAAALMSLMALAIGAPAGNAKWTEDPASRCRFVAPKSLTAGPTFWVGDCPNGKASGLGMLRRRDGDHVGPAFYGKMQEGVPQLGVIDDDEGYRVGAFHDGDIGTDRELEPQVRLDAFRVATDAARQVSATYRAENNPASGKFYEDVATMLDQQIE